MVLNGIPRVYFYCLLHGKESCCVLFRGMVRNGIPRICIYIGSKEGNSELCSLPQKGSEQNYGSLFLFGPRNGIPRVFSVFRDFLFRRTTGIPSEITICSAFRGIIFLTEIPNPSRNLLSYAATYWAMLHPNKSTLQLRLLELGYSAPLVSYNTEILYSILRLSGLCYTLMVGSLKMNTALEYSTRV